MELQRVGYNLATTFFFFFSFILFFFLATKLTPNMLGLEKPLTCDSDGHGNMASLYVFTTVEIINFFKLKKKK